MKTGLIETGKIVNTHGLHGCLRVQPWADSPSVLTDIEYIYIDEVPLKVRSAEVHKSLVLMSLEGVDSIEAAIRLKNKTVSVDRNDVKLEAGTYFIDDLIGLLAVDNGTGSTLGTVRDILTLPANNVYVVEGEREILIPAVPEFIAETNLEKGYIKFRMIEGL